MDEYEKFLTIEETAETMRLIVRLYDEGRQCEALVLGSHLFRAQTYRQTSELAVPDYMPF